MVGGAFLILREVMEVVAILGAIGYAGLIQSSICNNFSG
jgi:high-affinity Fe2+/Pb2+ permease